MYGLSKDLDLNFLSGREIEQIAIGSHEIIFAFDEDVSITVYSEFRFFDGQDEYIGRLSRLVRKSRPALYPFWAQ